MPREIVTHTTVYELDELDPAVREQAIENVRDLLGGAWWDESDNEDLGRVIAAALAEKFGTAGWDTYGVGDFPGIPQVSLEGWDMERGQYVVLKGRLTRDNAPALPWTVGLHAVDLTPKHDHTYVTVEDDYPDCTCVNAGILLIPHNKGCPAISPNPRTVLVQAVRDAMSDAWKAAYAEMEYKTSTEYALEYLEANERLFLADGTLYR